MPTMDWMYEGNNFIYECRPQGRYRNTEQNACEEEAGVCDVGEMF